MKKFLQKLLKKPLALVMALLIVVSSISVAVYAMTAYDYGSMDAYITLVKLDSDGNEVSRVSYADGTEWTKKEGTLNVAPGDKVRAYISLKSALTQKYTEEIADKYPEDYEPEDVYTDFNVTNVQLFCRWNSNVFALDVDSIGGKDDSGKNSFDSTGKWGAVQLAAGDKLVQSVYPTQYDYTDTEKYKDTNGDGVSEYDGYSFIRVTTKSKGSDGVHGEVMDPDDTSKWGGNEYVYVDLIVRNDIDVSVLSLNEGKAVVSKPFDVVPDSVCTLIPTENPDEPDESKADDCHFDMTLISTASSDSTNISSQKYYLTFNSYAESVSLDAGTVNFDTNNSAYNGLGTGTISTTGYTESTTNKGVYTANGIADAAIKAPVVTPTDTTNLTFAGWSTKEGQTTADEVIYAPDGTLCEGKTAVTYNSTNPTTLYAVYTTSGAYTLKVDDGKGNADSVKTKEVQFGTDIKDLLQAPSARKGYTYNGWDNDNIEGAITRATTDITSEVTNAVFDSALVEAAKNNTKEANTVSTTAIWNVIDYNIKYFLDDSTGATDTEIANYGDVLDEADQPDTDSYTKTGYSNEGEWAYYTDEACKVPYDGDTMPDQNLYAVLQWTENTYKFSFDNDNADAVTGDAATTTASQDVKFGEALTLTAPEKAGYTFQGWDLNGDETADINVGTESVTIDTKFVTNYLKDGEDEKTGLTAKALWAQNTYTITFTTGTTPDGSNITANETIKTFTYVYGDKFEGQKAIPTAASDPDKLSYNDTAAGGTVTATGWEIANAKIEDGGYIPLPEDGKATLTVPAQWTKLYTVTFKFNDGKTTDSVSKLAAGKEIKVPELPTYEGHTFAYWYTVDENTEVKPAATVDADNPTDLTYIAKWTVNKHSVSYYLDDNKLEISESEVPYGTAVTVKDLAKPAEGYQLNETAWTVTGATVGTDGKFTMPDNDVTLKLTTKAKNYDFIIHYGDYQKLGDNTQQVAYKAATPEVKDLEAWTDANNIRHTFKGWEIKVNGAVVTEIPTTMPYYTVELTPVWDDYYTLTYDYNDGTTEKETHEIISGGALVDANTPNPTKEGYSFGGWTYTDATGATISKPATMTSNVTATATWNINQYTVKYTIKDCDKAVWNNVSKTNEDYITAGTDYNSAIPAAQNSAVKDGYDFKGWSYASESGLAFAVDENTKMPAFNLVATPKFEAKDVVTTIKDGDKDVYSGTVKFDTPIDKDGTIKPAGEEGKEEGKWYVRNDDGTKTEIDLKKPLDGQISYRSPLTIEAIYTVTDKYYIANGVDKDGNFTYDTTAVKAITEETGYEYTVPGAEVAVSEKYADAFEFKGWATKPNDAVSVDTSVTTSKLGDTSNNYYAVYDLKEYTVTFLNEDGTVYDQKTYKFGAEIDQPDDPEKLGYTFQYWNDADGKKVDDYGVMPAKNLTFSPYFMSNDVSATFMKKKVVGDEYVTFETVKETVGEAIKTPDGTNSYNPFKLGYKFTGWADENGKSIDEYTEMPNGNIKFYAQYELDETAIALTVGGVVVSGAVVGTALAANAALITTGAVVGGVAVVAGAAALAKHTHKVTYYVDGEVYKTYYCVEGTKVLTPDDPSKDGYTFAGWDNEIPEKMPANDLEFNATWSGNVDDEIPDTGSATAGLAAFAVISSAAAAAYVLTKKKKDEE